MVGKHPFTGYPAVKHPKHSKFAIRDMREKPVNLFYCSTRASILVFAITLPTQVPLQKFPFLFLFIIPCINTNAFVSIYHPYYVCELNITVTEAVITGLYESDNPNCL